MVTEGISVTYSLKQRSQRIVGEIWSSSFALERIGKFDDEDAKMGVFATPVWDKEDRRLARKIRNIYAHEFRSIDEDGSVRFTDSKGSRRTHHLPSVEQDLETVLSLLHRVRMNFATAWQCPACGELTRRDNDPCLQCADPWKPPPSVIPLHHAFCSIGEVPLPRGFRDIHRWTLTPEGWDLVLTEDFDLARVNIGPFISPKEGEPVIPLRS